MRGLGNARMRAKCARAHERRGCNGAEFRSCTRHGHDPDGNTDHRGARARHCGRPRQPGPHPVERTLRSDLRRHEPRRRRIPRASDLRRRGVVRPCGRPRHLGAAGAAAGRRRSGAAGPLRRGLRHERTWWTGGASVLALLLGGLVAGAAARSPGLRSHPGRSGGVCGRRRTVPRSDGVRSGCRWRPRCGDVGVVREQRP